VAIIKEYGYGLSEPSGGDDQVNCVVSIDIARLDQKATRGPYKSNRLPPRCGELKLNPIISCA
jgi:hypothetical protein